MINGKIIKVCGMREAENIQDVEAIEGIDMLGFIFYPKSPRCVYELPAYLPTHASTEMNRRNPAGPYILPD